MAKAREWCAKAAAQGQEKAIAMLHDLPEARLEDEVECRGEEWLSSKAEEARSLLLEIRKRNASSQTACELLDGLLQRVGELSPEVAETFAKLGAQASVGREDRKETPKPALQTVQTLDAAALAPAELARRCVGLAAPLLLRGAAPLPGGATGVLAQLLESAGEDAVEWE